MEEYVIKPIGQIHTPHTISKNTPIQPVYAEGIRGTVTVLDEYAEGLQDLDGFSHLYLVYLFHKVEEVRLTLCPYLEDRPRGLFATRAPFRPNRIGLSIVRLVSVEGATLHIEDVDILDGTPLLDIKPYCAKFDVREDVRSGWQDGIEEVDARERGKRGFEEKR